MTRLGITLVTAFASSIFSPYASSADGVLEINQTCALNGGCFAGDNAGFPVTINGSAGRSYRLTGDLDLTAIPNTSAIDIDVPFITLDLNGFEIAGPVVCTGSGPTLECTGSTSGSGVALGNSAEGASIHNGTLRNMGSHGVGASASRVTMTKLRAFNNGRDGLNGGFSSIATECIAVENGDDGFQFGVASVIERSTAEGNGGNGIEIEAQKGVVANSATRRNGGRGFELGHSSRFRDNTSDFNTLPDRCGGGLCTERKRIYITTTMHDGANVLGACADGFHMASLPEIWDFSNWQYDYVLGDTRLDSGQGPPVGSLAWIRSGSTDDTQDNCDVWTSNDPADKGRAVILPLPFVWDDPPDKISPWIQTDPVFRACSFQWNVWCAED